jgi:cytosine/adenosine deaminase-related metal-dependent hydrolase
VLCYETTDRHGRAGAEKGLAENERYLRQCGQKQSGRFAALAGAHASFTLEDSTLSALAAMANRHKSGVHIHVAEDPCDEDACRQMHGISLIDRLDRHGLLTSKTVFAHGTHLDAQAVERVNQSGLFLAHNARSNMNNAVGYSPVGKLKCPVMLGTDGIGADMFAEARTAWFKSRDGHAGLSPMDIVNMLANSARRASSALGVTLGKLQPGAAADVVITDYRPFTPLSSDNLLSHLLFALSARSVRHVLIDGLWALRDRTVVQCDEHRTQSEAQKVAAELWKRMEAFH